MSVAPETATMQPTSLASCFAASRASSGRAVLSTPLVVVPAAPATASISEAFPRMTAGRSFRSDRIFCNARTQQYEVWTMMDCKERTCELSTEENARLGSEGRCSGAHRVQHPELIKLVRSSSSKLHAFHPFRRQCPHIDQQRRSNLHEVLHLFFAVNLYVKCHSAHFVMLLHEWQ